MGKEGIVVCKVGYYYQKVYDVKIFFKCKADFYSTKCGVKVAFFSCPNIRGPPTYQFKKMN